MIYMSGKMTLSGNVYIGPMGNGGGGNENPGGGGEEVEPIPYERFADPLYTTAFAPMDSVYGVVLTGEITGLTQDTMLNTLMTTEDFLNIEQTLIVHMGDPDRYNYGTVHFAATGPLKSLELNPDIYGTGLFELSYRDNQIWSSYINNGRLHLVRVGTDPIVQETAGNTSGEPNTIGEGWVNVIGTPTPQTVPIWRYLVGGLVSNPITGEAMRSTDLISDYYDLFVGRKLKYNNVEIVDIDATATIGDFLGEVNDLQPGRIVAWIEENVGDAGMSSRMIIVDKGNNPISVGWRDPSHEVMEEPTAFEVADFGFGHDARYQGSAPANTTFGTEW